MRVAETETKQTNYESITPVGEPLTTTTIDVKAKRLENSQLYIHVYQLLQTNLYINYAIDRMKVLDAALDIALDPHESSRDRDRYMKIFLDATEKPKDAKDFEFNVNITNNDVTVVSVEDKMSSIASSMKGMTANQLVEVMHQERTDED